MVLSLSDGMAVFLQKTLTAGVFRPSERAGVRQETVLQCFRRPNRQNMLQGGGNSGYPR